MSQISFEEDNFAGSHIILGERATPKLINLVLKTKLFKSKKNAYRFLVTLTLSLLIIAAAVVYSTFYAGKLTATPYDQMSPEQISNIPWQEQVYIEERNKKNR